MRRVPIALLGSLVALLAGCGGSNSSGRTAPSGSTATTGTAAARSTSSTTTATTATSATVTIAGVVRASTGTLVATLRAGTHHPRVNRPWPIAFTVTRGGHPAQASVSYEYLFAGSVVARRSHYAFSGRFADTFLWPAAAVGYPLTFRAVIVSGGATVDLDYPVQVLR